MRSVRLHPHPSTPCVAVDALAVQVDRESTASFALRYELAGDLGRVRIPARTAPARRDGLFRQTCFEMFVRVGGEGYRELNFSPSGDWAAYSFTGYRAGMKALDLPQPPVMHADVSAAALCLEVRVSLQETVGPVEPGLLRLALCAVIEDADGRLSYWAAAHPGARPDFHHCDAFVVEVGAARAIPAAPSHQRGRT